MAILDGKLELMDAQSIACAAGASVDFENVLDLGTFTDAWDQSITADIGEGGELYFNVRVATTIVSERSQSIDPLATVRLYTHTTAAVTAGTLIVTGTIHNLATAGVTITRTKVPAGTISRYLGGMVCSPTTIIQSGALDAWISLDSESEVPVT